MDLLEFNNLSFTYDKAADAIFSDISLRFYRGWTGVAGRSGAGKTTLAKLIMRSAATFAYYAPQQTDDAPENLERFTSAADKDAILLRDRLKIGGDWSRRWDSLSHGERKRAQIAAALYANPRLLIADEPTNHLDGETKAFLTNALKRYDGFGLLISHDRELLDELCKRTIFIENGGLDMRDRAYSVAAGERERERRGAIKRRDLQSKEIKKLERLTQTRREKAEQSDKHLSKRGLSAKDSDARERIGRAIVSGKDASDTKILSRLQSRLRQAKSRLESAPNAGAIGVTIEAGRYPKLFPIAFENAREIGTHSRVGITGRNGSGKSRFVDSFAKSRVWERGELLYLPQEIKLGEAALTLKSVQTMKNDEKGFIMSLIARLGSDPKALLQSAQPSLGETRKIMLALGLLAQPAIVVMDEPTNHLDIASIEALENALKAYNGALLLVSHDQRFLSALTDEIWRF
ncbi:MAG: ATP-binding cassette domain-containing protein [Helicobacteraceae bacterium]|jgi:ATPase subunit of ABC transporter with duplicated ATPase domains|nr:ATP-binding cassette domain-containing protein [Helicobacteraceae bacterium]